MTTLDKELIYVGDPQCSWCWGFAPVKGQIEDLCRGRAVLSLVVGGLHADWTAPADAERKAFLRDHWREVGERTGQPFKYDILDVDGLTYGTEASCRAAVTVRQMDGNQAALNLFTGLQRAYYADSRDVTSPDVLADIAAEFGHDRDAFAAIHAAPETSQRPSPISSLPSAWALKRMIVARHTCFWAVLWSRTTASRRRRSVGMAVKDIPVRMCKTHTCALQWESPIGLAR